MNATDHEPQQQQQDTAGPAPDPEQVWGPATPLFDALVARLGDPFTDNTEPAITEITNPPPGDSKPSADEPEE